MEQMDEIEKKKIRNEKARIRMAEKRKNDREYAEREAEQKRKFRAELSKDEKKTMYKTQYERRCELWTEEQWDKYNQKRAETRAKKTKEIQDIKDKHKK